MKQALFVVAALALQTSQTQLFEFDSRIENPSDSERVCEGLFTLNSSVFLSGFTSDQDSHATNSVESGEILTLLDRNLGLSEHGAAWLYTISVIREAGENREPWNDLPLKPWIELTPSIEPAFERPVLTLAGAGGRSDPAFQWIRPTRSAAAYRNRNPWVLASKDARRSYDASATYGAGSTVAVLFDPATLDRFSITEDRGDKPLRAMFAPVDVPEPSTYVAVTALALGVFAMLRRMRR